MNERRKNDKIAFLCSTCWELYNVTLREEEGKILLYLLCHCNEKPQVEELKDFLNDFLLKPSGTEGLFAKINCTKHKALFTSYCFQCQINACFHCLNSHRGHKIALIVKNIDIDHFKREARAIELLIKSNQQQKNDLLKRIDQHIAETLAKYSSMKKHIQIAFEANSEINQQLKHFIELLHSTALLLKPNPTYQIAKLFQTLHINYSSIEDMSSKSIDDAYSVFYNHLKTNFILKQTRLEEVIAVMKGHSDFIHCVIQLASGHFASCSDDKKIMIWDKKTHNCIKILKGHSSFVKCLLQLSSGTLTSGSYDKTIMLWDTEAYETKRIVSGHSRSVNCLIELLDGQLASGSSDGSIMLWNTTSFICTSTLEGSEKDVGLLLQLRSGLLISSAFKRIVLWDVDSRSCKMVLAAHKSRVTCLVQLNDKQLLTSGSNAEVKLWNSETFSCETTLLMNCFVRSVVLLNNGLTVFGYGNKCIKVYHPVLFNEMYELVGHQNAVSCLCQTKDGKLLSGSYDETLRLWNI